MAVHGPPQALHSDQGPEFQIDRILEQINDALLKVTHRQGVAYHPQSNGVVERSHRTTLEILRKTLRDPDANWMEVLPFVQFCINNRFDVSRQATPFFLYCGRQQAGFRDFTDATRELTDPKSIADAIKERYAVIHDRVWPAFRAQRERELESSRERRDARSNVITTLEEGTTVYLKDPNPANKLSPTFTGPFEVASFDPEHRSYVLRDPETGEPCGREVSIEMLRLADPPRPETMPPASQEEVDQDEQAIIGTIPEPDQHSTSGRVRRANARYSQDYLA
jgi:hypothetical protein